MENIAQKCTDDLIDKLRTVPAFSSKSFAVLTVDDLENPSKALVFPSAGVIYTGMRSVTDKQGAGLSVDVRFMVVLFARDSEMGVDNKARAVDLLDQIRDVIKNTRSPTGHKWFFRNETPFPVKKPSILAYAQEWFTQAVLTSA